MTVLRDLVARLGFDVDGTGFTRAETMIGRVRGALTGLAAVAGTVGVGAAVKQVLELASDAQETVNVLQQSFGPEGAAVVQQWAEKVGTEIGRSRYEIEGFTATMGAMLGPMLGSKEAAQDMSTTIAQLAVDLGSFFNTSDNEALVALRAGIAGESEPLRRFGVVLLDATLQEFALAQGIHKRVQSMNVAEKTQLRYQFIMANTATAQGDAARTSDSYANSVKALRGSLRDMGTEIGASILPKVEKVIRFARDGLAGFKEWAQTTTILETSMASVAAVALIAGAVMLAPWAPLLLAFGALVLVLDDINALFQGGTSVIGFWLDSMFGIGTAAALVETYKAGVEEIGPTWDRVGQALRSAFNWLTDLPYLAAIAFHDMADGIRGALNQLMRDSITAWDELRSIFGEGPSGLVAPQLATGADAAAARKNLDSRRVDREANRIAEEETRKLALGRGSITRTTGTGEVVAAGRGIDAPAQMIDFGVSSARSVRGRRAAAAAPAGPQTVNVGGTTVNVNGGDIAKVKQAVREVMDVERRKTAAAVARAGG
jgi:hypothetical protein